MLLHLETKHLLTKSRAKSRKAKNKECTISKFEEELLPLNTGKHCKESWEIYTEVNKFEGILEMKEKVF